MERGSYACSAMTNGFHRRAVHLPAVTRLCKLCPRRHCRGRQLAWRSLRWRQMRLCCLGRLLRPQTRLICICSVLESLKWSATTWNLHDKVAIDDEISPASLSKRSQSAIGTCTLLPSFSPALHTCPINIWNNVELIQVVDPGK